MVEELENSFNIADNYFVDPDKVSLVFRRHTAYNSRPKDPQDPEDPGIISRGFLNPEGYHLAQESARSIATRITQGTEVVIGASPSFMIPRKRGPILSDAVLDRSVLPESLRPQRALFTARIYGRELYKLGYLSYEPQASLSRNGVMEITGIEVDRRLGDLLEDGNDNIPGFYQVLKDSNDGYGGMTPAFWHDFVQGSLKPKVREALEQANYWDSLRLAGNLASVIEEKVAAGTPGIKHVAINITHGEVIDCFLHHLIRRSTGHLGLIDPKFTEAVEQGMGYNQGFDAHIDSRTGLMDVQLSNGSGVQADMNCLKEMLEKRA